LSETSSEIARNWKKKLIDNNLRFDDDLSSCDGQEWP